jgi:TonB family protein
MRKTILIAGSFVLLAVGSLFLQVAAVPGLAAQAQVGVEIPAKYQKWLDEEVVYIITPLERKTFLELKTDKDRDAFIEAFWKSRDPNPATEVNEFREQHYLRLRYADEQFSTAALPGWKTDAGRLYIITGARSSKLPARGQTAAKLRFFEGIKDWGVVPAPAAVTSSFLRTTISASYEAEADLAREQRRLAEVFNLQSVKLVTEADIDFSAAEWERHLHMFQLNGRQYVVAITALKGLNRREFRVVVDERSTTGGAVVPQGSQPSLTLRNVLDTEVILPVDKTAVFGFQDAAGKPYFLSVNIAPPPPPPPQQPAPPQKTAIAAPPAQKPATAAPSAVPPQPQLPAPPQKAAIASPPEKAAASAPPSKVTPAPAAAITAPPSPPTKVAIPLPPPPPPEDRAAFERGAVRLDESKAPRLLKRVEPRYPEVADQARIEGTVVLDVRTDIYGRVKALRVVTSIPLLDQAAYDAVKQWVYDPVIAEGKPVEAVFPVRVTFVLGAQLGVDVKAPLPQDISASAVEIVGEVSPPRLLKYVEPRYPEIARQARVEGHVMLAVRTDIYGRVEAFKILRSIPLLDQAAVDCVKQWVYEPLTINGQPRKAAFTVTVRFELTDQPAPPARPAAAQEPARKAPVKRYAVPASVAEGAVTITEEMEPLRRIKYVDPVFSEIARMARTEGDVVLAVRTDEQGRVEALKVLRSIRLLNDEAVEAVKQWIYEPLVVDGRPRKAAFIVTVSFVLSEARVSADRWRRVPKAFQADAVRFEEGAGQPKRVKEVEPVYPTDARMARMEGTVILAVRTDEEGRVEEVMVLRSIPKLDPAAVEAVRQWVYEPLVIDGQPRKAVFPVTFVFKLK